EEPRLDGIVDGVPRFEHGQLGGEEVAAQRDREQERPHRSRQPRDACSEQLLHDRRHRYLLADPRKPALNERPPDLDREQRVPARGVGDAPQELTGNAEPELLVQQSADGREPEGADLYSRLYVTLQRPFERRG